MRRIVVSVAAGLALGAVVLAGLFLVSRADDDGGGESGGDAGGSATIARTELEQIAPRQFQDWRIVRDDTGFRGLAASWPGDLYGPEREQLTANGYVTDYLVRFRSGDQSGELFANLTLFETQQGAQQSERIGLDNVTEQTGRPAVDEPELGSGAKKVDLTNAQARLYGYFWRVDNVLISVTALGRNLQGAPVLELAKRVDEEARERAGA
jgi:hypothetical protein